MLVQRSGIVRKIYASSTGKYCVQVAVNKRLLQTYIGLDKRPNLVVGDKVKAGEEI